MLLELKMKPMKPKLSYPSISVVTPSYNQGRFIEKTIDSVLRQDYPNFEHIIVDGGSSDQTLSVLRNHQHIDWVSEADSGQSNAVNKGFHKATGEIIAWINSDDWYETGAFEAVADFFINYPQHSIVMGNCRLVDVAGTEIGQVFNHARGYKGLRRYWLPRAIPTQPAIFFKKHLLEKFGYLDESLHYAMDYDLWLRFAASHEFYHLDRLVANYRFHPGAKGGDRDWSKFQPEWELVYNRYVSPPIKLLDVLSRLELKIHKRIFE